MFRFGCGRLIGLLMMLGVAAVVIAVVKLLTRQSPVAPAPRLFCAKCGAAMAPEARFCPSCGSAVS
jgi:hypothetical protein